MDEEKDDKVRFDLLSLLRRRWPYFVGSLLLVLLILILLPYGIKLGTTKALTAFGADETLIEDVDFNPFTRTLVFDGLRVNGPDGRTLLMAREVSFKFSWLSLLKKHLYLERLTVRDGEVDIERLGDGGLSVGGMTPKRRNVKEGKRWGMGFGELTVYDSSINYRDKGFFKGALVIYEGELKGFKRWAPEEEASVKLKGLINDGALEVTGVTVPFASSPGFSGKVKIEDISLEPFSVLLKSYLKSLEGKGDLTVDLDIGGKKRGSYSVKGRLSARGLNARWAGDGRRATLESFVWNGSYDNQVKGGSRRLKGNLAVTGLNINTPGEEPLTISLAGLDIIDLDLSGSDNIEIKKAAFNKLSVDRHLKAGEAGEREAEPLINSGALDLSGILVKNLSDFSIDSAEFYDLASFIRKVPGVKPRRLTEKLSEVLDKALKDKEGVTRTFRISRIDILGKSSVDYRDERIDPPYKVMVEIAKAGLTGLDTSRPKEPVPVSVNAKIGDYSFVSIDGDIMPFEKRASINLTAKLKELDLPPLSPYTEDAYGYILVSGHMDADIKMNILAGKIESENSLLFKGVKVSPVDETKLAELRTELTVPLGSALNLLRDKDNKIRLKFPVSGDLGDPKVSFAAVINKALVKSMKGATISYLKYYFQPYGTFITIGKFAFDEITRLRLDPVFFLPGTVEPAEGMEEYLDLLAGLMKDRRELELRLCARSVTEDLKALNLKAPSDELLLSLSKERALFIKDYLYAKHGIPTQRLFLCSPGIDKDKEGVARVEILL